MKYTKNELFLFLKDNVCEDRIFGHGVIFNLKNIYGCNFLPSRIRLFFNSLLSKNIDIFLSFFNTSKKIVQSLSGTIANFIRI